MTRIPARTLERERLVGMECRDSGQHAKKGDAGFTLTECLIAISLFAMVLITILLIYDSNQKTYVRGEAEMDLQQNIRVALGQIAHDVRLAGYDPSNAMNAQTVKYPLQPVSGTTLSNSELRLIADADGDGTTDCVAYRLSSGQILRRKTSWSSGACAWTSTEGAVAENITTLRFTYYPTSGGTATTDPTQARRVVVSITGTSSTYGITFTAQSETSLRQ